VNTVTGQNEANGTSIIDVTDPSKPKYLAHIPGQDGMINEGGAQMTRNLRRPWPAQGRSQRRLSPAHLRHHRA